MHILPLLCCAQTDMFSAAGLVCHVSERVHSKHEQEIQAQSVAGMMGAGWSGHEIKLGSFGAIAIGAILLAYGPSIARYPSTAKLKTFPSQTLILMGLSTHSMLANCLPTQCLQTVYSLNACKLSTHSMLANCGH